MAEKSTLINCNLAEMNIGKSHVTWSSVGSNTTDVKRGITKTRMLTGVYMLQSTKSRFNQYKVEQICSLCSLATEDLQHMLLRCLALSEIRGLPLPSIRSLLIWQFGSSWWLSRSGAQIVSTNINGQINSNV